MGATNQGKRALRDIASGVPPVKAEGNVLAALTAAPAAAPAGGTGVAAGGWSSAADRDAAIVTINGTRTRVGEIETRLKDLGIL